MKEKQKRLMKKKWAVIKIDLRKYSIKDNEGEKSRKKHEDAPDGMYEKLMIEDEVKEVYRDRSVWGSVLSDFPTSITAWS